MLPFTYSAMLLETQFLTGVETATCVCTLWPTLMCIQLSMFVCVQVHGKGACPTVYAYVWRPRTAPGVLPSGCASCVSRQGLYTILSSLIWLAWLDSNSQGCSCPCLHRPSITGLNRHDPVFMFIQQALYCLGQSPELLLTLVLALLTHHPLM